MTTTKQIAININHRTESLYNVYNIKVADTLLSRDWFDEPSDIIEVLDATDNNAFEYVYCNRHKYSTRIRKLIEPKDYKVPLNKLNIRVVDLTDSRFEQIKIEKNKKREALFENDWNEYSKTIQERCFGDVDSVLDDIWDKFNLSKNILTKYIEKPIVKKYTSPSSRVTIDPKQKELENNVRMLENEYDLAQKAVDDTDTIYWNNKKDEYRTTWMPTL